MEKQQRITITQLPQHPLVHAWKEGVSDKKKRKTFFFFGTLVVLGILSGYVLAGRSPQGGVSSLAPNTGSSGILSEKRAVGSSNTTVFRDSAEGALEIGGIDGEGTHHLVRPGGISQTVYLTSSVLDLNQFVGKNVRVWGETFSTKTAGWFMDVGRVEEL